MNEFCKDNKYAIGNFYTRFLKGAKSWHGFIKVEKIKVNEKDEMCNKWVA